jgi:NADH:ubiquinone reductase (H+-translocating)
LFDMSKNSTVLNTEKVNGRPRVVIVGGGFGGLWAARALADVPVEVLVVDRNNYHTFLPLLYQVAAAELEPSQIGYPIRTILRGVHNADFVMGEVTAVDPEARQVQTKAALIDYDYLILATGSIPQFFGIPGAEAHTFPMKTMEDGIRLRNHILRVFEEAERETDPVRRRRLLTFVTIGGGPSGVEFAGALAELIHGPLAKDYPTIDLNEVRVVLVEAASNLLNTMPERLGRYTAELLESKQVEVRLASIVSEVTRHAVYLRDGSEIFTETAVWTAGVGGQNIAQRSGLPTRRNGTVEVEPTLQIPGHPNVFVIGDLAAFKTADGYLPMVAPVAMQQGAHTAQNIGRQIKGEALRPFTYTDKGSMAVIGRNAAVANIAGRAFTGFLAWLIWIVVHVAQLIGFRNRIMVLINWAWNYILYERVVRLILASEMPPAAPRDLEKEEEGHVVRI